MIKPGTCAATLLLLLTLLACGHGKGHEDTVVDNYADSIKQILSRIDSSLLDPALKIKQLKAVYLSIPVERRPFVCRAVFDKMFFTAYAHPDSTVEQFYKQQQEENEQFPRVRIEAAFAQAAYDLYINQQPDSGMRSLEKAKSILPPHNDTLNKSYYTLYAQAMLQKGDFKEAANYYLKTIAIAERFKDSASIIGNYGNLAVVYSHMNDEEKALPVKKKCLDYYIAQGNNAYAFIGEVSLARSYANLGKMDSAFYYYNKSEELIKSGVRNPSVEIILYTNLGEIYSDRGDLEKALHYFELCKAPLDAMGSEEQRRIYNVYSILAYAHVRKDINKEIEEVKKDIDAFAKENDLIYMRAGYYNLYLIADMKKRPGEALDYYMKYDSVNNILAGQANNKYIAELQTKYETQKKEARILLQQKEIEKNTAFNKMLILLLLTLVTGTAFIITRNRLRRRRKEAELQQHFTSQLLARGEEERGRIARDLHDGLSQSLLVLKNQLSSGAPILPEKIDHVINEVRTISRNIHPVMLGQIGLKESILHICHQISEAEQLFIATDIEYNGQLEKQRELQLFRVIQEALNNVVKYADAQAAKVQLYEEGNLLFASIQDNGKGFDVAQALHGSSAFGLLSILERSKAVKGKAFIISDTNGTIIKIEIPING